VDGDILADGVPDVPIASWRDKVWTKPAVILLANATRSTKEMIVDAVRKTDPTILRNDRRPGAKQQGKGIDNGEGVDGHHHA